VLQCCCCGASVLVLIGLAGQWLKELGVRHLRTDLSWADSLRPGAERWFDRQRRALEPFDVTVTFCFTQPSMACAPITPVRLETSTRSRSSAPARYASTADVRRLERCVWNAVGGCIVIRKRRVPARHGVCPWNDYGQTSKKRKQR